MGKVSKAAVSNGSSGGRTRPGNKRFDVKASEQTTSLGGDHDHYTLPKLSDSLGASIIDAPTSSEQLVESADVAQGEGVAPTVIYKTRSGRAVIKPEFFDALKLEITGSSRKRLICEQQIEVVPNSVQRVESHRSPKRINDLPDLPLIAILGKLDTYEQLLVRFVCRRWKLLIELSITSTQCLMLNFAPTKPNELIHAWNPARSVQSLQFETNWTVPALIKMAKLSIREDRFTNEHINMLLSLFPNVHMLVIYFDLRATNANMDVLIKLIQKFTNLKSFSIIRSVTEWPFMKPYVPRVMFDVCRTLAEMNCTLTRMDLYIPGEMFPVGVVDRAPFPGQQFLNLLPSLDHFNILAWPIMTSQQTSSPEYQCRVYLQWGRGEMKQQQQRAINVKSLCLMPPCELSEIAVWKHNRQFANIRRLQLNGISDQNQVKHFLDLCPQIETLGLYYENFPNFFSVTQLEWINQHKQLTELIVKGDFATYEAGPIAPNIRKLTICKQNLFNCLFSYGTVVARDVFEDNFVKLIVHKFPSLKQLTLLNERLGKELDPGDEEYRDHVRIELSIQLPTLTKVDIIDLDLKIFYK